MEFVSFRDEFLPEAAKLLACRHRLERKVFPELPPQFENPEYALKIIKEIWDKDYTEGIAVFKEGKLAGYIIGHFIADTLRGRYIWVDYAGLAIGEMESPELYRDLYTNIAGKWIKYGCFDHYILVPASNPSVVDAWLRLGFSYEQVHGLCRLNEIDDPSNDFCEVEIRLAKHYDREMVADISSLIMMYQAEAPVWGVGLPEDILEIREGYAELVDDKEVNLWLALKDEKIIGFQGYWSVESNELNMMIPHHCVELKIAGTNIKERGRGIGSLLTQKGFSHARKQGNKYCIADWRITNILASRFWLKQGFRPIAYRLTRKIDTRILWANGKTIITK